jgi:phosphoketolase
MTPLATADSVTLSVTNQPLSTEELRRMNAYWRAANYLSVGQIYLLANPLRGYKEEGTTTTPFDMTVTNDLDRFHLAGDVVDRVPKLQRTGAHFQQFLRSKLVQHKQYICEHGDDMPEVKNWKWPY